MSHLNLIKTFTSLGLVTLGILSATGCAADATEDDQTTDEEVAISQDELGSNGGCHSRATTLAHANRVCGPSNHVIDWRNGVTRYRRGGEWRHCAPNFFVSVPFECK